MVPGKRIITLLLLVSCSVGFRSAKTKSLALLSTAQGETISIALRDKTFVPAAATVKAGDSVTICNRDPNFHSPFSYSRYNKFGYPKGIRLAPGTCTTRVARNPTKQEILVRIFDEIHAREKLTLTVLPTPNAEGSEHEDIPKAPVGETPPGQEGAIVLRDKLFVPLEATVKDGDSVMFCNRDPFFHSPFSYSEYNKFGSPKGVRLAPGQCFTHTWPLRQHQSDSRWCANGDKTTWTLAESSDPRRRCQISFSLSRTARLASAEA